MRVPKRGTGAERPVVARKPGNAGGAKGLHHLALAAGQPRNGEEPVGKVKLHERGR